MKERCPGENNRNLNPDTWWFGDSLLEKDTHNKKKKKKQKSNEPQSDWQYNRFQLKRYIK